ncbi:MAG: hypothetical protein ACD_87C00044G0001 [uncultured bacterium]|nr:MAG: hypothetical protein ACD_87C00044G0001 [uncultured bacterium]
MYDNPPAARDVTDDLITGDRIAAPCITDHDVIDPGQRNAEGFCLLPLFQGLLDGLFLPDLLLRQEMMDDMFR